MNAFDLLPLGEKVRMIKLRGEFINTIPLKNHSISLYRVGRILVEHYIDNETKKTIKISSVQYFDLVKYLPHVSINSLYQLIA